MLEESRRPAPAVSRNGWRFNAPKASASGRSASAQRRRRQSVPAGEHQGGGSPAACRRTAKRRCAWKFCRCAAGILRFTGVTLARPDPLGLFRAFSRIAAPQTVLILPKRYPLPPIALPGTMKYQEGGVALAANVGRSEEFVALREYRRGDPLRHIHWRSWAKAGRPIVKEFEDEFFVRHALVLDTFTDEPHSEMLEEAVSVAASFACTVLTQESLLDLLFVGSRIVLLHRRTRPGARGPDAGNSRVGARLRATSRLRRSNSWSSPMSSVVSGCICVSAKMGRRAEKARGKTPRARACRCWCWSSCRRANRNWTPARCATSRKNFTSSKSGRLRNNSRNCHEGKRANA